MDWSDFVFICHHGGDFETSSDGSLSYIGGTTHANLTQKSDLSMRIDELTREIVEYFKYDYDGFDAFNYIAFEYLQPGDRKTLITATESKETSMP
ncbi:hypothetical protein M5689_008630 [Euphorbia peplus]|nr:hypothetical protein M5689_008630 [Euphorbia peplus]